MNITGVKEKLGKYSIKEILKNIFFIVIGAWIGLWITKRENNSQQESVKQEYLTQILKDLELEKVNSENYLEVIDSILNLENRSNYFNKIHNSLVQRDFIQFLEEKKFKYLNNLSNTLKIIESSDGYKILPIELSKHLIDFRRKQEIQNLEFVFYEDKNLILLKKFGSINDDFISMFDDKNKVLVDYFSIAEDQGKQKIEILIEVRLTREISFNKKTKSIRQMLYEIDFLSSEILKGLQK